jgi:hypothetical protein
MSYDSNPDWYRTKHALARELVNWVKADDDVDATPLLDRAERSLLELLRQAEIKRARPLWGCGKRVAEKRKLRRFIVDDVVPSAQYLLVEIEAVRRSREAGAQAEPLARTVPPIPDESADNPDVNFYLARVYAETQQGSLARETLQRVVDVTTRPAWGGLANKIARDPALSEVVLQPDFQTAEGFDPFLHAAMADVQESVESAVQVPAEDAQDLD